MAVRYDYFCFTDERNRFWRLRHFLRDGQHEDREGEQHGDAQADLLSGIWRKTEDQNGQGAHHHAREHDVVPEMRQS